MDCIALDNRRHAVASRSPEAAQLYGLASTVRLYVTTGELHKLPFHATLAQVATALAIDATAFASRNVGDSNAFPWFGVALSKLRTAQEEVIKEVRK